MPGTGIGTGIAWRKGKRGGSPAPGQSLFDAYKARVEADSGTVQNNADTLKLFNEQVEDSLRSSLVMHVAAQAGNRLTSGNVNKAYGLNDTPYYDAVQGAAAAQPELFSDGYQFGDSNKRLVFSSSASYAPSGSITVMTWANPVANLSTPGDPYIGKIGVQSDERAFSAVMADTYIMRYVIALTNSSLIILDSLTPTTPETFSHFACVYNALAQEVRLYTNGQPDGVFTAADGVPAAQFNDNGFDWAYGDRAEGLRSSQARLNDGRIYDAALSASQIQAIYNNTKGFYGIS